MSTLSKWCAVGECEDYELTGFSEEEEDEDEAAKPADADKSTEAPEGEKEDAEDAEPKQKKSKNDSFELVEYSPDELRGVDKDILTAEITALEEETAKAKPNLNVLHEYRRREAEFLDRARDLEAVTNQRDAAKQRYDDLRKVRLDEFMAGFSAISSKLKEMYQVRGVLVIMANQSDDHHGW